MLNKAKNILATKTLSSRGFAVRDFLVVLSVICTFSIIGVMGLMDFKKKACITIVRYDLKKLFEAEQIYYGDYDTFKGSSGDVISNDPAILSTFKLDGFTPSVNTSITITEEDPFTTVGRNEEVEITFTYNLQTNTLIERH
jgi:hypothetical protein